MNIGMLITRHCDQHEFTQKELALRLGISPQYLNDIIQGKRSPADQFFLDRLAFELRVHEFVVYFAAGVLPPLFADLRGSISEKQMYNAMEAMRAELFDDH